MLNKAEIIGRLGQDPEAKTTTSGKTVVILNVATDNSYVDKSGEKQQKTEWHRIVAWGKVAESCAKYLKKGRQVYVEGKLQTRSWDDKDGVKRFTTEIIASRVLFLGDNKQDKPDVHEPSFDSGDELPF